MVNTHFSFSVLFSYLRRMKLSEVDNLSEGVDKKVLQLIDLKTESDMEKILMKMDVQTAKMDAIEKRFEDKISNFKWTLTAIIASCTIIISLVIWFKG